MRISDSKTVHKLACNASERRCVVPLSIVSDTSQAVYNASSSRKNRKKTSQNDGLNRKKRSGKDTSGDDQIEVALSAGSKKKKKRQKLYAVDI